MASVSPRSHWEYLPTVVIVDDDANVREALFGLLTSVGFTVAVFSSVKELVANGPLDQSGCLILDVRMPGQSGLEFQEQLLRANARRPIIFISGHADVPMSVRAMKGGAIEFLTKPIRHQDLLEAVNRAIEKDRIQRTDMHLAEETRDAFASLTRREREIMSLVILGHRNKQIAAELGISEGTVKLHRGNVMQKMQISSLAELIRVAQWLDCSG